MIIATAVLHNIARDMNEEEPPVDNGIFNADELDYLVTAGDIPNVNNVVGQFAGGRRMQQNMLNYFNNL